MTKVQIRKHLIDVGVRNLREFGYPQCDATNILTDLIYKAFFLRMLEESKEESARQSRPSADIDSVIGELIAEIKAAQAEKEGK